MSYVGISVREALNKLNAPLGGWFLPQVQRQYVWGDRHESEDYVCLLLDSLVKRYPIGGVVLWETMATVPYRAFVENYKPGHYAHQVDKGRWGAAKSLVYDGQQRLQTLFSVLYHSFNSRILHFNVLFDVATAESDETGFLFRDSDSPAEAAYLRLSELATTACTPKNKVALESRLRAAAGGDASKELLVLENFSALWDIFVDTNVKSIAYFSVQAETATEVNEIFRRLNTGGMALTQLELVLGKIKAVQSDYEEGLWKLAERIRSVSGGIEFSSTNILQFIHLMVKKTIRIDEERMTTLDVTAFQTALVQDADALVEVFQGYLSGLFHINHVSIVPRWLAVLPIAAFLASRKRGRHEWRIRALRQNELELIHRYFLLSQFCDWNTQTMVNAFARLAMDAGVAGEPFPFVAVQKVAVEKNRTPDLHDFQLQSQRWFAAKVLMPRRAYVFHERKPQVDHIFPLNLEGGDEDYRTCVDTLWNFQPVPDEVNNYKRARHPQEFFSSDDGRKYWDKYDFIPSSDSPIWSDYRFFLSDREARMREQLQLLYGLTLVSKSESFAT